MVFDHRNGVPLITERTCKGFWRTAVAEIIAFINGARTLQQFREFGCAKFWDAYAGDGMKIGVDPDDMGPGSYGPSFHDFPIPGGGTLNQFKQLLGQIQQYPSLRTHLVTPWQPYFTARGPNRKVIVAPCHGWLHLRVLDSKLHLRMDQRSADFPIGVPSNMIQYAALHLMLCQVTGLQPGNFVHSFGDAHIYENQVDGVKEALERDPRPFPTLRLDPDVTNLFDFRVHHFELAEYDPHPGIKIPFAP
jgi:thymidylate synthase